ncbi:MAG: glycogen/starch/alpha-glucan phosphorylase [Ruoffia tabacinasalis]|uniref:Alpha-1,4 glucan phosphorylase n=1 Tax=Ruoffia tabacinasalis TaxID=87458 RepID=A0A5R9DRN2_9LACT|nr:glycogen/starch/alpha-glucan phosphorylase [Ruoffia tabacinasalis]TLQ39118.1 glycogen/starch/alpha-glucan phosphorylase [Ruoffia tabacinasalis]HBY90837.1 maltose phosphorylase [Aerococcaceae bacterium]
MSILENYVLDNFDKPIRECSDQEMYKVLLDLVRDKSRELPTNDDKKKKLYYFSAEFLIGKLLSNNLLNLGIYDEVNNELIANGKNIMDIEQAELEPSLGNGGLGRLAACFVDSITTLGINGDGVGLNYHFGLFKQVFKDNQQTQLPDPWITEESWLIKNEKSYEVPFNNFTLKSTLYDIDVLGYNSDTRNRLRLFDLDSVTSDIIEEGTIHFDKTNIEENLTLFLYPDDSDREGELLRIFQQYYMVSNGAQLILDEAVARGSNLHDLAEYAVIQINDTHPAFVIPEMIRLLTQRGIDFDEAIQITQTMTAFTNHTILAEALEKWPIDELEQVMPEIANIIRELDNRKKDEFPNNHAVSIIDEHDRVHMAHMAIHYGYSINGVAALHTEILKNSELKAFFDIYPNKFINKTNGITFRRWIMDANKELADFIDDLISDEWRTSANLEPLLDFKDDENVLTKLRAIKFNNKQRLSHRLETMQNVTINEHSIIDVHIKRIHEYKRQQMLLLYIIHKYNDIKNGNIPKTPITIIFGGKAAAAYTIARDIIHAILTVSEIIANDDEVNEHFQVVMVENYNVTHAQYLIPATDISEQISLASKEASGTGNMKFMLNGALTLCTLDGANVEIADLVGEENIYIFGKRSEEIVDLYATNGYNARSYYERETIKPLVDFLMDPKMLELGDEGRLSRLHYDMINKDYFMALIDLEEFIEIKEKVYEDYEDHDTWTRKALINIAKAGFFSSDRTINEYNRDIWHLEQEIKNVN